MKFGCSELLFEHLPRIDSCERFDIVFGFLHKDYAVSCPSVNQLTVTTELARFPGDLPADPRHVLVYEDPRTLQFAPVSHDRTLGVVAGERGDDIARCRLVVPRPPYPVGAHGGRQQHTVVYWYLSRKVETLSFFCPDLVQKYII